MFVYWKPKPPPPFPPSAYEDLQAPTLSCYLLGSPPVGCALPCCVVDPRSLGSVYWGLKLTVLIIPCALGAGVWEWGPPYCVFGSQTWLEPVCLEWRCDWGWAPLNIRVGLDTSQWITATFRRWSHQKYSCIQPLILWKLLTVSIQQLIHILLSWI